MTKISIIIPVYNVENYLSKCLNSVINQTLKDIEIICISNNPNDNSLEILEDFAQKDSRIKVIKNDKNYGPSTARNMGIKIASGEYIGFVDSDDHIDLDFYEKLYNAAKHYNTDIACCNIYCERKYKSGYYINYSKNDYTFIQDEKQKLSYIPRYNYTVNKIYNREKIIKNNRFFIDNRCFEDCEWLPKTIYTLEGLSVISDCNYYYNRQNLSCWTANLSNKDESDYIWAVKEYQNFADIHNLCTNNYDKKTVKLFGITILKIYPYHDKKVYKLLGFIPFITISNNKNF